MPPERVQAGAFAALAAGPPDGELVLCLHGFPDHAPTFTALLEALAASGHRAVAPWMRGYAPSTLEGPYHLRQLADDALAFLDRFSPDRPACLVGHDWGAVVTYAACARAPERIRRAVTLAVPHKNAFLHNLRRHPRQLGRSWYMLFFQLPVVAERALVLGDFALVERLWRDWSPGFSPPPGYLEELKRCLAASMPAPIEYYRALGRRVAEVRRSGRRIAVPTLHLHGATDGCVGPELSEGEEAWFAAELRREVLPGMGHFLHLERPDQVNGRILSWLATS